MKSFLRVTGAVLTVLMAGCGAGVVSSDETIGDASDALSSTTSAYVTVKRDVRRCASPMCGGYFLKQPNHSTAAIYVKGLDFAQSNLGDVDQAKVTGAPDDELLLFGKLSAKDSQGYRSFVVTDAYRGLPARTTGTVSAIYKVIADNGRRCIQAPCDSMSAHKLNSTAADKKFSGFSAASAAYGFVDQAWLQHRVLDDGAIVMGTVTTGAHLPGGDEKIFDATQIFLHLPEGVGPCPALMQLNCAASGQVNIYSRNENRCEVPAGCTTAGVCAMMMPACPDGYSLTGARGGTSACMQYVCDPSWVLQ